MGSSSSIVAFLIVAIFMFTCISSSSGRVEVVNVRAATKAATVINTITSDNCGCNSTDQDADEGCNCFAKTISQTKMTYHPNTCDGDDYCYPKKHCGGGASPYCDGGVCKCPN